MADSQYPVNAIQRKILPTLPNAVVTKFDADEGYTDRDKITNEAGLLSNILGVDFSLPVDAEIVITPNYGNIPQDLTTLTFNTAGASPNFSNFANANVLTMLIDGQVKFAGPAGKGLRYQLKLIKTAVLPTVGPG